jgi:hypothetical protein
MFEKLAKPVSRKRSTKTVEIPLTQAFVATVQSEGYRLSYAALATAAKIFGEDSSKQIAAQRGSTLVKSLPATLHATVCRKSGGYDKKVLAAFVDAPKDLCDRPVIVAEDVAEAIKEAAKASEKEEQGS